MKNVNALKFERLDNDLKYSEFNALLDVYNALKIEAPKHLQFTSKGLIEGLQGSEMYLNLRYPEHKARFDPFKRRVVEAIAKGLTNASVQH